MSTNYPGSLDSYSTKVDGVDDVLAAHINNPQDAIEALEAYSQTMSLIKARNTSGATVAANDIGYLDEAGEFKTTTSAYLDAAWCVVISGAANNSDIIVARRGRVTVELNANCSAGDSLYTSTTTGQAQPQSYMRAEAFAVAITANAGGAGGTCTALLMCNTLVIAQTSSTALATWVNHSTSAFNGTINGAPSSTSVIYTPVGGNENTIEPGAAGQLAKAQLHNITRGNFRLIDDVNVATNTITTVASTDDWANNDVINIKSTTVTTFADAIDLDLSAQSVIPVHARYIAVAILLTDSGGAGGIAALHPYVTPGSGSEQTGIVYTQVADVVNSIVSVVELRQRRFDIRRIASGAGTCDTTLFLEAVYVAAP